MLTKRFTLIIPTYNRPDYVARQLVYFAAKNAAFRIFVLDGGSLESQALNRTACEASPLNVVHRAFAPDTRVEDRLSAVLDSVETDYLSLCGDDDILLPEVIPACVEFLDDNPDFAAAHGDYFNFHETASEEGEAPDFHLTAVQYCYPSLRGSTPLERVVELMYQYEALYYAVVRTENMKRVHSTCLTMETPLFSELFQANGVAVMGKVLRSKVPFLFRNTGTGTLVQGKWQTMYWFVEDGDELFREYIPYRDALCAFIQGEGGSVLPEAVVRQSLDMAHALYFVRTFDQSLTIQAIGKLLESPGNTWEETLRSLAGRNQSLKKMCGESVRIEAYLDKRRSLYQVDRTVLNHIGEEEIKYVINALQPYVTKAGQ